MSNPKTKVIDVITGEKMEGDVDPSRAIQGTSTPSGDSTEVEGRSCQNQFMFECPWCKAINYTDQRRASAYYVCFVCSRPMNPGLG
jgi:hypothetical protein